MKMLLPLAPSLVRNVIYPVYRGLRGDKLLQILQELEENQYLSPEELEDIQWRRMSAFLEYIANHVPYYRELFEQSGWKAEDFQNPTDLLRVPLLTKEIIRREGKSLVTTDPLIKGYDSNTGGSTGEPLYFKIANSTSPYRRANTQRCYRMCGIEIGEKQAYVWGFPFNIPRKEKIKSSFRNYFNNITYLSSFNMSEQAMRDYALKLKKFKPAVVIGYPSAVTLFAEFCRDNQISGIEPRAVISSGEKMYPPQREVLEEFFGCPVFDRYGSNEFANVAHECDRHKGLHVFNDLLYVEVLHENGRPAGPGEVGEIVITDFLNRFMPFVRYRTGDMAVQTDRTCECGRGLPLLERIEGRTFDTVMTNDGRFIGGYFWTYLSRVVPGVKQFQVEQKQRNTVTFRIVPGPQWEDQYQERIIKEIVENMGPGTKVNFEKVAEIPLSPAGKFRFILSKVEERMVVKSKIHKASVTGEDRERIDCIVVDEEILELSNIAPCERVLIVDNDNGARVEAFVVKGERGSQEIVTCGGVAQHIHAGDEVIIMAFTWSEETHGHFTNILVDESNKFVRYLTEKAGDKI
ncbi:MAG: aspartate 1-decarboxylase [Candidatus Krumholzibacteriota bacterium]|nr:aspartate 1-decarboxylase [Candidatus Krumholzibacteriota bacterium]